MITLVNDIRCWTFLLIVAIVMAAPGSLASCHADDGGSAILQFADETYIRGELQPSSKQTLRWLSPRFAEPLEFPTTAMAAIRYPQLNVQPRPEGEYCFELSDDDVIYGNLVSIEENSLVIDSPRFGLLTLGRDRIRRFYRWQGENLIYLGPLGLEGWREPNLPRKWRDNAGMPATTMANAALFGDFGIPPQAVIEFDLSWQSKPDFIFALGVDDGADGLEDAFRFEVWNSQLVAIAESKRDADVASILRVQNKPGNLRLQAYLDQERRIMLLYSHNGDKVEDVELKFGEAPPSGGLRITNRNGDLQLNTLRISRWDGVPPVSVMANKSRLHGVDGSILYGEITAFEPSDGEFTVRDEEGEEKTVPISAVTDVFFPQTAKEQTDDSEGSEDSSAPMIRATYHDGSRISGRLKQIDGTRFTLVSSGLEGPLHLPDHHLREIIAPNSKAAAPPKRPGRRGRLDMEGVTLYGRLTESSGSSTEKSCLVWSPDLAVNASPLRPGSSGQIVYRETTLPAKAKSQKRRPRRRLKGFANALLNSDQPGKKETAPRFLHLRSGDTIPGEILGIDDQGVLFSTPVSAESLIPHWAIKAIELGPPRSLLQLPEDHHDQLTTLPRFLREAPPTHLICSRDGDFLRGRILDMNDEELRFEVRLETKVIPRDRLAHLIWFHPDEVSGEPAPVPEQAQLDGLRVQAVRRDGSRLTFHCRSLDGDGLKGVSQILGECAIPISEVDQLLIGTTIEQETAELVFHRWKLHHAPDPQFVEAMESGSSGPVPTGTQSPLVGQPAPNFRVSLLDGTSYELSERLGRVVILDFWATWCGPCLETMPLVERVAGEFEGVELVAVNMEEQPSQIKPMLERHKLAMSVALDQDGLVAARYEVSAIPQTVVIDRDGKIARLFVGGSEKLEQPLRQVLAELSQK